MEERNYDFLVLWNDGYAREAGVMGYPTTWVVDQQGGIAFDVLGGSQRVLQELGWRVEALLEAGDD
jgi:hypothetical protein